MKLILYDEPVYTENFHRAAQVNYVKISACGEAIMPTDAVFQQRFGKDCLHFTDFSADWCQRVDGLRHATIDEDLRLCFCTFLYNANPARPNKHFQLCLPVFIDIIPVSVYRGNAAATIRSMRISIETLRQKLETEMGQSLTLHKTLQRVSPCVELVTAMPVRDIRRDDRPPIDRL